MDRRATYCVQTGERYRRKSAALMRRLQVCNLARKERISRELLLQTSQQLQRSRLILLSHIGNGKQNSCEGRKVMSVVRSHLQVGNSPLLIGGQPTHVQNP